MLYQVGKERKSKQERSANNDNSALNNKIGLLCWTECYRP